MKRGYEEGTVGKDRAGLGGEILSSVDEVVGVTSIGFTSCEDDTFGAGDEGIEGDDEPAPGLLRAIFSRAFAFLEAMSCC